jgi:hypothetical protein
MTTERYFDRATLVIRYSPDATISMVWDTEEDEAVRCPTQADMDNLPVGADLTDEEISALVE